MNEIETLQPKPFRDIDAVLYAPRDEEDVVPNPFAIPPEWLAAWQAEADDRVVMEAAAAEAKEVADLKALSAKASANVKPDGIIASLSAAIPKFFQKLDEPEKKSSGPEDWLKSAQDAVSGVLGGAEQQVQSVLSSGAQQAGHGAGAGATQGVLEGLTAGIPNLISAAQQALDPAVKQIVTGAVASAKPGVEELAHSAGKHATMGAQEQLKDKGTGLDTTTWLVGGVAVLGALGLGAWLLSSNSRYGATSTDEFQKMLDSASWTRPSGGPTVKWLEAPKSERYVSKSRDVKSHASKDAFAVGAVDSGLGTGVAIVGGASALAVLIGYLAKGKFDGNKDKTAGGAYGTGLGGSSPSGHIAHRSSWAAGRQAGGIYRASPYHPYTLADAFGLSKEHLHLDENAILGSNASSQDRSDYAAGYPIGRKAGLENCDATHRKQPGTVYVKDATKSLAWDNGWLKGYYDGWVAEGCKVGKTSSGAVEDDFEAGERPHGNDFWWASESTANGVIATMATRWSYFERGPEAETTLATNVADKDLPVMDSKFVDQAGAMYLYRKRGDGTVVNLTPPAWGADHSSGSPDTTWNYVFTYSDGSSQTDPTPTPNAQITVTDNLVPDTAKAAKAVKVERVRATDNSKVTVWTADKGASGPPPAFGIMQGLWDAMKPWQRDAAYKYQATHPDFGSDFQEMIRVLAITPDQIKKANASYVPFAGADAMAGTDTSSVV